MYREAGYEQGKRQAIYDKGRHVAMDRALVRQKSARWDVKRETRMTPAQAAEWESGYLEGYRVAYGL